MFRGIEYIAININILSSDTQCKQKVVDGMLKGLLSSVGLLSYYSFSKNYSVCMLAVLCEFDLSQCRDLGLVV